MPSQHVCWVSVTGDGTDEATRHWAYSTDVTGAGVYTAKVVNPNGTKSERVLHRSLSDQNFGFDDPRSGHAYEERLIAANGTMLRRSLTEWAITGTLPGATRNPRVTKTIEILLDTGGGNAKAKTTTMVYDVENPNYYGTGLNVIETKHYDYADVSQTTGQTATIGSIPLGTPINTEKTMYLLNDPAYAGVGFYYGARNMIALPTATWIENPSGVTTARAEFKYDEGTYPVLPHPGSVNATQWTDPQTTYRGTVTTTRRWLNMATDTNTAATTVSAYPSGTWLETHTQTDVCGSVRKSWDARQKVSEVNYNATYAFAYPVEVKTPPPNPSNTIGGLSVPYATNQALVSMMTYDFTTGKPLTVTDPNLQVTTNSYAGDPLQRLTKVTRPTGGGETIYEYYDTPGTCACDLSIKTRTLQSAGTYIEDMAFFDGIGRAWRGAHKETGGKWTVKDTQYDNLGRVWKTANPVLTGVIPTPTRGSFALVNADLTPTSYDELDRPLAITTPDSSVVYAAYSGNQVTVADQANGTANPINGNAPRNTTRRSITDALGRLTQVIEAPGSLNYTTNYTYDSLGNLVKVDQGGQLRFFMYDSASRLVRARNPEQETNATLNLTDAVTGNSQWMMEYAYDSNGNLQKRWDARGKTTTYDYDDINRNLKVAYGGSGSSPTPTVERYYDAATLGKGKPWRTISYNNHPQNAAQLAYQYRFIGAYDNAGRPTSGEQRILNSTNNTWVTYPMSRSYDLASHVTSQSYPSTRSASYSYGADGRLSGFTGNLGDGVPRTYADTMLYNAAGQMTQERFVTNTQLYHSMTYNKRFQMYDNRLGTSVLGWNRGLLLTYYSFAARQIGWPGYETSGNNGNVWMQEHYVPTNDAITTHTIFRDYYEYDDLNRIKEDNGVQKDTANNWTTPHKQSFNYDQWGNRTINAGGTWGANINNKAFEPDVLTNRLSKPGPDSCGPMTFSGMCYDKAGNQVFDDYSTLTTMSGGLREYDGENRLTKANGPAGFNYYGYDADGQRTRRVVWDAGMLKEFWQVYSFDGELIAEYPANGAASTPQKEYGYRNGQLLVAAGCDIARWLVADHLGTPRIEVDVTGSLANVRRHDYLPFGEELTVGMGNSSLRSAPMGYAADCVRQKFGSQERDNETGLDFFQSRYFSSTQGRFTKPDTYGGRQTNPQTLNLYAYVLNNPLKWIDPTGHFAQDPKKGSIIDEYGDELIGWDGSVPVWDCDCTILTVDETEGDPGIGEPGPIEGWIPLWGAGRTSAWHFENDRPLEGAVYGAMAISDLALIKTAATAIGRGLLGDATAKLIVGDALEEVALRRTLVIGENMTDRVIPFAEKYGFEIYPGMPNFRVGMEAEAMLHNQAFIETKMAQGFRIVDIGPDFAKRAIRGGPSPFYNMERTITKGYEGFEKTFTRTSKTTLTVP